jgi:hypothetical protein
MKFKPYQNELTREIYGDLYIPKSEACLCVHNGVDAYKVNLNELEVRKLIRQLRGDK